MPENYDVAVYYDAWENDNGTDPVLSLVYEIIKQLGINYAFDDNSNAFKLAGSVLEALTGRNINGIIENLKWHIAMIYPMCIINGMLNLRN